MNLQNKVRVPSPFSHDAIPIIYIIVLGLTTGYFITLALMYGPSYASPGRIETGGMALSIYVSLGLVAGVIVSAILATFV
ncbi:unnamed protein product [Dicrocoelium dendriticum]|nr:unnamed protein product [Dicrocoelium dendriticum]